MENYNLKMSCVSNCKWETSTTMQVISHLVASLEWTILCNISKLKLSG